MNVIEHLQKKYLDTGIRQVLLGALNLSCAILLHLHFDKTVAPPKIAFYQYVSKQNYIIANAHNASYGQDAREIHLPHIRIDMSIFQGYHIMEKKRPCCCKFNEQRRTLFSGWH